MRRALSLVLFFFGGASLLAADQTVTIGPSISFTPATVMIVAGEKVTWVWAAPGHSTTSDATSGPEVWDSGILAPPQTFSHTFMTVGTFPYYCVVHGAPGGVGMSGVVQVGVPGATPTPTTSPTPTGTTTTTPSPSPAVTSTPTVTAAPAGPPGAIPALGLAGRLVLVLGLAAVGVLLLSFAFRR